MPVCIYCRYEKPAGKPHFTREHVIPEAFAKFKGNLVLHDTVCAECNQLLGDTIDLDLARDSAEGLERYMWGIKGEEELRQFRFRNVTMVSQDGETKGMYGARTSPDQATLIPQVGFRLKDSDDFKFYLARDVRKGVWLNDPEIDWRLGVKIVPETARDLIDVLETQGVTARAWNSFGAKEAGKPVVVHETFSVTTEIARAFAKIAFNYLAFAFGADFALRAEFDATRKFVRYGKEPFLPCFFPNPEARWQNLEIGGNRIALHVITVQPDLENTVLLGQVMLFGRFTYDIVLSYSPIAVDFDLHSGHAYNVADKRVLRMGHRGQLETESRPERNLTSV